GRQVLPIPKQLIDNPDLKKAVINFIIRSQTPHIYNPEIIELATILKSRKITEKEFEVFYEGLEIPDGTMKKPYYVTQDWYPRIWDEWTREKDGAVPDDIFGEEKRMEFTDIKRSVNLSPLCPKFASKFAYGRTSCANEISFNFYGADQFLAEVFPKSSGDNFIRTIKSTITRKKDWRIGRNGLVKLVRSDFVDHWSIPLAQNIFFAWLKDIGWKPKLSTPGIIAKQIYNQLEGRVEFLANEKLLELFEHMNNGPQGERERSVAEIKSRLKKLPHLHDYLIDRDIFKIGIKIKCPNCLRNSWYSADEISQKIKCPRCLNEFSSIGHIDKGKWCYRTTGPFSIPGYADGGFSVLLALNFFGEHRMHDLRITPTFSFNATDSRGNDLEADFGAFWQESSSRSVADGVMFGECKTFGLFEKRDIQRMTSIAKQFPGAMLVFCTLKKKLDKSEIKLLTKITKAGRKYWKNERPINPVLILTGNEILNMNRPPHCWKQSVAKNLIVSTVSWIYAMLHNKFIWNFHHGTNIGKKSFSDVNKIII
ncbi:hypothetical protein LCGC14_1898640, partial [marine sediment metagenome]